MKGWDEFFIMANKRQLDDVTFNTLMSVIGNYERGEAYVRVALTPPLKLLVSMQMICFRVGKFKDKFGRDAKYKFYPTVEGWNKYREPSEELEEDLAELFGLRNEVVEDEEDDYDVEEAKEFSTLNMTDDSFCHRVFYLDIDATPTKEMLDFKKTLDGIVIKFEDGYSFDRFKRENKFGSMFIVDDLKVSPEEEMLNKLYEFMKNKCNRSRMT